MGKVLLNGKDVNLEQIRLGMDWYYRKYKNELVFDDRISYLQAEEHAMKNRFGLWLYNQPTAPWEFRKSSRTKLMYSNFQPIKKSASDWVKQTFNCD